MLENLLKNQVSYIGYAYGMIKMARNNHTFYGIFALENLEFDTPFDVADLQLDP